MIIFSFLVAFMGLAVLAVTAYEKKRESAERELEGSRTEIAGLLDRFLDILQRHPDLDLSREEEYYFDFRELSEKKMVSRISELENAVEELEMTVEIALTGKTGREYKTFSPNGFKDFYNTLEYPAAKKAEHSPDITGHKEADRRIVGLAEKLGYRLRPEADSGRLVALERHRLQPEVIESWNNLEEEALKSGIRFGLISGFRSVERQREKFLKLLHDKAVKQTGHPYTHQEIADGALDRLIGRLLATDSIPGYSKHHTGYTIDITDLTSGKHFTEFRRTPGFDWISANNYLNAKRFGFIPSYPEGAVSQGPEPEAWEYVWVGEKVLRY